MFVRPSRAALAGALAGLAVPLLAMSAPLTVAAAAPVAPAVAEAAAQPCPTPRSSVIRSAPGSGKTVALTFDDGPGGVTPQVLAILRTYGVRATFFNTGAHDAKYPSQTTAIAAEGHLVAGHTWSHRYPSSSNGHWSRRYLNSQFDKTNAQQLKLTGKNTCFWRPPGGFRTSGMVAEARKNHMSTVLWSVDTNDWKQPGHTTKRSTKAIANAAKAGYKQRHPIVLLHVSKASHEPESKVRSNRSNDVAALPAIIRGYQAHGYRFVDLAGESGLSDTATTVAGGAGSAEVPLGSR